MKVKSNKPGYAASKREVNTAAGKITFEKGIAEITDEQWQELSHPRYGFMQLVPLEGGEKPAPTKQSESAPAADEVEAAEQPAPPAKEEEQAPTAEEASAEEEVPAEEQAAESTEDPELAAFKKELLEKVDTLDKKAELQEVAELAELPEEEWKGIRSKADLVAYLKENLQ